MQEDEEEALWMQLEEKNNKNTPEEEEEEIKIVAEVKKIKISEEYKSKDEKAPATAATVPNRSRPLPSCAQPITFPVIPLLQPNQLPHISDFAKPTAGPIQEPGAFTPR